MFSICFHIRNNNKANAERLASGKNIVPTDTINGTISSENAGTHLLMVVSDDPAIIYDGLSSLLGTPRRTTSREMKKIIRSRLGRT